MIDWAAIKALRDNRVPESEVLDYKRDCYGNSDASKREILKDISSFANTRGGHIVIGVAEEEGVPTEIVGIDADVDLDAEVRRMVSVINNGFDPAFTSVQIRPVSGDGTRCLVIDIPRSVLARTESHLAIIISSLSGTRTENTRQQCLSYEPFLRSERSESKNFRAFSRERTEIIADPERDTTGIVKDAGLLIVKPAFDSLYNALGKAACPHFSEDGTWQDQR